MFYKQYLRIKKKEISSNNVNIYFVNKTLKNNKS